MIVVAFHNVLAGPLPAFGSLVRKEWLAARKFEKQLDAIAARYRIVPLSEMSRALREGTIVRDTCAITFDDGCLGAYRYAAPLLEEHGLPATFFLVTGRLDERAAQDAFDRLEALLCLTEQRAVDLVHLGEGQVPLDGQGAKVRCYELLSKRLRTASPLERAELFDLLERALDVDEAAIARYLSHEAYQSMTWDDARDLGRRGFSIGSHSRTHIAVSRLEAPALEGEIAGSYRDVVQGLGTNAGEVGFAYPFGKAKHVSEAAVAAVQRAGYGYGLMMERGRNGPGTDVYRMRRMVYKDLRRLDREAVEANR